MDPNRKLWNNGQQTLRRALTTREYSHAIEQFMIQHAMVHSHRVSQMKVWSFEDQLWLSLTERVFRTIPPKGEHSIAWILFHSARIEDITMNRLSAGTPQLYIQEGWAKTLKSTIAHSANKMEEAGVRRLSDALDMNALRAYRLAVGRRTRAIVKRIQAPQFDQRVDPLRLQQVLEEGAVMPEALEIIHYWGGRTIAGLLLMPPTRHNFIHLNEALKIKQKLSRL